MDQKARLNADGSSTPGAAGDFFSQSKIFCADSHMVLVFPREHGRHQHRCAHTGSCTIDCTHTKMLLTLAGMGSAALVAAVTLPT